MFNGLDRVIGITAPIGKTGKYFHYNPYKAKEIYVIFFDNGGDEDSWRTVNYGYTDKKEKAEKIVQSLNNQLELDKEKYQYLEDHWELIFNEKGRLNDSEYAKEYEHLIHKYPNYSMGDDGFFDYEILKELELD